MVKFREMGRGTPTYGQKFQSIVYIWENPCNASWFVYFETAIPALGRAIVELVTPTMLDVVRGYFRPKNLKTGRHKRRKRRGRKRRRGIPDTSEVIAKNIPRQSDVAKRGVKDGVKNLWRIDGAIQRVFWYWLIAEVTLDFFMNWHTGIMKTEYCEKQYGGSAAIGGADFAYVSGSWLLAGNRYLIGEQGTVAANAPLSACSGPSIVAAVFYRVDTVSVGEIGSMEWGLAQTDVNTFALWVTLDEVRPLTGPDNPTVSIRIDINGLTLPIDDPKEWKPDAPGDGFIWGPYEIIP